MSWNASLNKDTKANIRKKLEARTFDFCSPSTISDDIAMEDQLETAIDAALVLLKSIPGPMVTVNLSGHANGIGYHAKEGWSNDTITVTVTQQLK